MQDLVSYWLGLGRPEILVGMPWVAEIVAEAKQEMENEEKYFEDWAREIDHDIAAKKAKGMDIIREITGRKLIK